MRRGYIKYFACEAALYELDATQANGTATCPASESHSFDESKSTWSSYQLKLDDLLPLVSA